MKCRHEPVTEDGFGGSFTFCKHCNLEWDGSMTTNEHTEQSERAELLAAYYHMMSEEELRLWARKAAALLAADKIGSWKDGDTARLVNDLRDVAVKFRDAQQLRERIAHIIRPLADRLAEDAHIHPQPSALPGDVGLST